METDYRKEQSYLVAKKRVKAIKGFYIHFIVYVLVNLFLSGVIFYGLAINGNDSFTEAISNFGLYSTWIFWGIGLFFHWLGVFGVQSLISKNWEEKKIKELMEKEDIRRNKF